MEPRARGDTPWLDVERVDQLIAGQLDPDEAPPEFAEVAAALLALGRIPAESVAQGPDDAGPTTRPSRSRLSRVRIVTLATVGALLGTTGLGAARVLPDPIQDTVSAALSTVGISVPHSDDPADDPAEHPAGTGQEISQIATTTDAAGVEKGAEISSTASGGKSRAGERGADAGTSPGRTQTPRTEPDTGSPSDETDRSASARVSGREGERPGSADERPGGANARPNR